MTQYGNRGMTLEATIERANESYRFYGMGIVEKQNTKFIPIWDRRTKRIKECIVKEKATVDFMGRYRNIPVAFEAKHTAEKRIKFSEVQDHQARFLDDFIGENDHGFGAVIVSFNMERFFLVPWLFWKVGRDAWKNTKGKERGRAVQYGMAWEAPGKASVSADELLPEWEIKLNNKYTLPYLSKIDTYLGAKV